jgi:hypothetical protein
MLSRMIFERRQLAAADLLNVGGVRGGLVTTGRSRGSSYREKEPGGGGGGGVRAEG